MNQNYTGGPRARNYKFDEMKDAVAPEALTERELKLFKTGLSNAPFHYQGSAYIYGKIGKAFAEAMAEMLEKT
jgi:hypothetical protein